MPKLTINGIKTEAAEGTSVFKACAALGIEIPHFCHHDRLSEAANCRMCLVEMVGSTKPVPSCTLICTEGMEILTDSEMVRKARFGVMEFLLVNHPMDCLICDKGGECDLQDQAMAYGRDRGRCAKDKRVVPDKHFGPLITAFMNRCIHCTRCVRFLDEIAGTGELGGMGRGEDMEIGTFVKKAITTELSGNLIDICPVGALTSAPYAYRARPWDLTHTDSIDVMDGTGANIRIDSANGKVMRILPRLNEDINEEWLADKSRFACDGLALNRLDRPFARINGQLEEVSWNKAMEIAAHRLSRTDPTRIAALAGDLVDVESVFALKELMERIGSPHMDCRQDGARFDAGQPCGYLFNSGISGIERADCILLVGCDPRTEAPLINARIRKRWRAGGLKVGRVGPVADLTYPVQDLGNDGRVISAMAADRHPFCETLRKAMRPMLILGVGALRRKDGNAVQEACFRIAENCGLIRKDWCGYNMLHDSAGRVGALLAGFLPGEGGKGVHDILVATREKEIDILYLLGADEIHASRIGEDTFVIYQGHHSDRGAHRADLIFPAAAYSEKDALYVNTEGRVQAAHKAVQPPGKTKEDWRIIRRLSDELGRPLSCDDHATLRARLRPVFERTARWAAFGRRGTIEPVAFMPVIDDFYRTDPISRASPVMAECARIFTLGEEGE